MKIRDIERWLRASALALAALLISVPIAGAQGVYRADAVKAAFLYRFAGYIEWPEEASRAGRFTIAVLGSSSVAAELEHLLPERLIKNLPARVRHIGKLSELDEAHILFVSADYPQDIKSIATALAGKSILLVTDRADALDAGSAINFLLIDRRVRFEISVGAAERARLKVGAELLSVATRVREAPERADAMCMPLGACSCINARDCSLFASAP